MTGHKLAATLPPTSPGARILFVDNVRWTVILLVISMHAADTYSPLGSWYFVDRASISPLTLLTFAAWQTYLQSFFMGLLFLLAGVFLPASLARKGTTGLIAERAFRLGLPVLLYMFILGPVTEYFFAHSWTSTQPTSFASEWLKHIRNGEFLQENGPLWFCLALLIFSLVYTTWRMRVPGARRGSQITPPPGTAAMIGFSLGMAAGTFVVGLAPGDGVFLNMHLRDFPQYVLMFMAGIAAANRQWLTRLDQRAARWWAAIVLPVGFALWLAILLGGILGVPDGAAKLHGWHWQAAAFDLWQAFTCVALSLGTLVLFRERFNAQGPLARFLSTNAFSVFVFHPPVLIAAARLLTIAHWHPLVKTLLLTISAAVASFVLSATVLRRIPGLKAIL
jgi:hypothetical protein